LESQDELIRDRITELVHQKTASRDTSLWGADSGVIDYTLLSIIIP
jgi:hypothetical protein